jgi:hypothetical protein
MNELSFLLYLAHVSDNIGGVLGVLGVLTCIGAIVMALYYTITKFFVIPSIEVAGESWKSWSTDEFDRLLASVKVAGKAFVILCTISITAGLIKSFVPDRKTVTLIAASQIGEKIIKSPQVQSIVDPSITLLKSWMEQQTQSIEKEMLKSKLDNMK